MADVIFITSRLDVNHGGLTSSLLNKAGILYDEKNIKSIILTFHADANFNRVKSDILERYNLKNKVDILYAKNFYFNNYLLTHNLKMLFMVSMSILCIYVISLISYVLLYFYFIILLKDIVKILVFFFAEKLVFLLFLPRKGKINV